MVKAFSLSIIFFIMAFPGALNCLAALDISSPITDWTAVTYVGQHPDFFSDQQTGLASGDLVGDENHGAFYTLFDDGGTPENLLDGTIAFRARLAEAKNYKKLNFNYNLFVGMDVTGDGGLNLFVGVDNSPSGGGSLAIWDPGPGLNNSPSNTTIVNPPLSTFAEVVGSNYDFITVTLANDPLALSYDIDGGGKTDMFLSFSIAFQDIVNALNSKSISINQNSPVSYVMATSTQSNSLNMDLNGVDGGISSVMTFSQLGAVSQEYSASGEIISNPGPIVPEPASIALLGLGALLMLGRGRTRRYLGRAAA